MPLSAHTIQLKRFNYIQVNLPICRNHFPGVFEPQLDEVLSLVLVERRNPDHVGGHPVHRDLDQERTLCGTRPSMAGSVLPRAM